jgi:outer membrane autotransporter protein
MLLVTRKTKTNLVRTVLASSVLISSMAYMNVANAATVVINGADAVAGGGDDYEFKTDNKLTVPDGVDIADTAGVSADATVTPADGTILFQGSSDVSGSIGIATDRLGTLDFQGLAGTTVNITGDVDVDNLSFSNGGTVNFDGKVTVENDLTALGAGTANFNDDYDQTGGDATFDDTFTGNFNANADFAENLILNTDATVNLNTGTITKALTAGGTSTVNFLDDYTVTGGITLNDAAVINGTAGKKIDVGANPFALNNDAVANLFLGTAGAALTLNDDSTVIFNDNYKITTNLTLSAGATAGVASGKTVTIGGKIDTAAGSTFGFDLGNTITPGQFVATGNANITGDEVVVIQNTNASLIPAGTATAAAPIITGAANIAGIPTLIAPDSFFVTYSLTQTADTDINFVATRVTPSGLDSNISGVAAVLAGVDNTNTSGELLSLFDNLADISNPDGLKEALASVTPLIDGGLTQTVLNVQDNTFDLFSQRIAELRAGVDNYNSGYAAGHMDDKGHGTWIKVFGSHADQSRRDNVAGYTAETWGLAAGADIKLSEMHIVGVGLSWASSDVNHDLNSADTDINSYQGSLYGSWNIRGPLYMNWMASVAYNDYDITRHITANNFRQTTIGDMDGWQYGARAELGYVCGQNEFHMIPTVSLTYSHLDFDNYRENGPSTANQFVNYDDMNALMAGVGVKFSYDYEWEKSLMSPEVHVNYSYDFLGEEQQANAQFVQFGSAYDAVGASPARSDYNVGLSLTTYGDSGLGFGISYDYNWRSDYHAHSGFFRVRYEW